MMPGTMKHPMHMMPNGKWMKGASHKEAMAQMKKQFAVAEPVEGVELGLLKQDKAMVVEGEDTVPWHKMPDGTMMPGLSTKKPIHMMPDGEWMQGPSIKAMKKMNNQDPSPVMGVETDNEETAKDPDASLLKKTENMIVVRQDKVPWHKMPDGSMMPGESHKEAMHMMPNGKWMKGASHKEAVAQMKKRLYVASPTVNVETGARTQDKAMVVEGDDTVPWHKMPDGTMMPGVSMMKPMHMMPDGDWMQGLSIKAMKKMNKHVKEIPSPVVDVETTSKSQTAKAIRASMLKGNKNTILVHEDAVPWHMTPDGSMMPGTMKHPMHMMPNGKWMKGASHKEAMAQMKKQFAVAEPVEGVER